MRHPVKILSLVLFFNGMLLNAFYIDKIDTLDKTPCRKDVKLPSQEEISSRFSLVVPSFEREHNVITDPLALQRVARDALSFFKKYAQSHKPILEPQPFSTCILSAQKVIEALEFIDQVIEEDKSLGIFRINNPKFLAENFGFIGWTGQPKGNILKKDDKKIRLTSYVIYQANGSYKKTKEFPYALYQLLNEKEKVTLTKQEMLDDAARDEEIESRIKPLVWVSRETLEEALLQGTIILTMPDGKVRVFNVNISNGYKFLAGTQLKKQKVYWFFLERKNSQAVEKLQQRCQDRKGIVFAGDLYSLGFGKIIAIQYRNRMTKQYEIRLGVLVDRGSAFERNLKHLDLFGGIIDKKNTLKSFLSNFPPSVRAFILYRKAQKDN